MKPLSLRLLALGAPILVTGCSGIHSVLAPHGPRASEVTQLAWFLFGFATLVMVVVIVALWLALRGSSAMRARLAARDAVILGGIVFPAITLTGLLGYGVWLTQASLRESGETDAIQIEVIGEQWWWRVVYAGPRGERVESANEIRIPAGREVTFTLKSADVIHSFWIPSLGGKVDMIPGRVSRLKLKADRPGIFRGMCAEYCGGPHALMALPVVALEQGEFAAWLEREAALGAEPPDDAARRGKGFFLTSGCGACHIVRGTAATGAIGPDLTHFGGRRSVGIDTLAPTRENIASFIRDGQHIKPGNTMPPFRIFAPADLEAVASYLAGLK